MAFDPADLSDVKGLNKGRTLFEYSTRDTMATVLGAGYFDAARDMLTSGDSIIVTAADGEGIVRVPIVHGGVVAVSQGPPRASDPISIKAFGAKGNGSADDTRAFQDAASVARDIRIPDGTYMLTDSIKCLSGARFIGAGPKTHLINASTGTDAQKALFIPGNHIVQAWRNASNGNSNATASWYKIYPLNAVVGGSKAVTTTTAANAGAFEPGQFVFVRSVEERSVSTYYVPYYARLTKVISVDAGTGIIKLADPIKHDIANALISPVDATDAFMGFNCYICEGVEIGNMKVTARNFLYRGGLYRGYIHDIEFDACQNAFAVNCQTNSVFERLTGNFGGRAIELKTGTSDSIVRDVLLHYKPIDGVTPNAPAWDIAEQAHTLKFHNVGVHLGEDWDSSSAACSLQGFDMSLVECETVNNSVHASAADVLTVLSSPYAGYTTKNIVIERHTSAANSTAIDRLIRIGDSATGYPTDITIRNPILRGSINSGTKYGIRLEYGDRIVIDGARYEGDLILSIASTFLACRVDGVWRLLLADDTAYQVAVPNSVGQVDLNIGNSSTTPPATATGRVTYYTGGGTPVLLDSAATDIQVGTAALGTESSTGTDAKFNVHRNGGILYFKNRLGSSQFVRWRFG